MTTPYIFRKRFVDYPVSELLLFAALGIWITATVARTTLFVVAGEEIIRIVRYGAVGLALMGELIGGRHTSRSAYALVILAAASAGALSGGDRYYLQAFILIFCARSIDYDRLARFSLLLLSVLTVTVIFSSFVGIIPDYIEKTGDRIRHYLGFRYALYPAELLFAITTLVVYLRKSRLALFEASGLLGANAVVYLLTNSRLSFALSVLLVLVSLLCRHAWTRFAATRTALVLAGGSFVWCAVIALVLTSAWRIRGPLLARINAIFGNRLALGYRNLKEYGIHVLGHDLKLRGNALTTEGERNTSAAYNYIDSLYVKVAINYGWLFLVLFVAAMTAITVRAWRRNEPFLLLVLVVIAGHCLVDDLSFNLEYNPFVFLIGHLAVPPRPWNDRYNTTLPPPKNRFGAATAAPLAQGVTS